MEIKLSKDQFIEGEVIPKGVVLIIESEKKLEEREISNIEALDKMKAMVDSIQDFVSQITNGMVTPEFEDAIVNKGYPFKNSFDEVAYDIMMWYDKTKQTLK